MAFIVVLHVIACLLLVVTILMQSGRGGGLAESFSSAESMFGTQTNTFMVRLSTILAIVFFSTSLILAINSAKGDKSLMAQLPVKAAQAPVGESTVKVGDPKPMVDSKSATTDNNELVESQPTVVVTTNTVQ